MSHEVRRSKLIAPHGPGALIDLPGNISVVVGGPRQWELAGIYPAHTPDKIKDDPRLARFLGVNHFRMPPSAPDDAHAPGVPVYRCPRWHYCSKRNCGRMVELDPTTRMDPAPSCPSCRSGLIPFRWIAICDHGHMQDVPLRWWVHKGEDNKSCQGNLRYSSGGAGDTMASITISCEQCNAQDHLGGLAGRRFTCQGRRPWLGNADHTTECRQKLRVVLKGASNVYYPVVHSGLFIPPNAGDQAAVIDYFWGRHEEKIREKNGMDDTGFILGLWLSDKCEEDDQLRAANVDPENLKGAIRAKLAQNGDRGPMAAITPAAKEEYRYAAFQAFSAGNLQHTDLSMRNGGDYDWGGHGLPQDLVAHVVLLDKLRETRVLTGFQRLEPDVVTDREQLHRLLWGDQPGNWLPAIIVRGEGIFIRFNDDRLNDWEGNEQVQAAFERHLRCVGNDSQAPRTPRFLFLHTLAHLLMRRLTFECGYGSSSLRERIYCHEATGHPMNAIVIYTASGDSDGSLGGLVRQGEPGRLEPTLRQAIEDGEWCSSDPVCSDIGRHGRGPGNVNGAACHNCVLVAETSCEVFNKYLDRKFVIDLEPKVPSLFHLSGHGIQH